MRRILMKFLLNVFVVLTLRSKRCTSIDSHPPPYFCSDYVADVCPTLVAPANGNIAQGANEYGDTAVYSCNAGFTLTGVRIRTCLNDGQWSGKAPVCEGKADLLLHRLVMNCEL